MKLYCFDVDGTLLTDEMEKKGKHLKGIIPTQILIQLEKKGHTIVIVSPSPFLPYRYSDREHWIKKFGSNEYRWANVNEAMQVHGIGPKKTVYVDDLESNRKQMESMGVKSYSPEEFMELIT